MIITITLNPAIDKTAAIDSFVVGGLNRLAATRSDAGGKGINVSRTIHALGLDSVATGFLGRANDALFKDCFAANGITDRFVMVEGSTRTNIKLVEPDGRLTEINEPGPRIGSDAIDALWKVIDGYAGDGALFVLSGSLPQGIGTDVYGRIIDRVRVKGAKVILDADGPAFAQAITHGPTVVKPNDHEIAGFFGCSHQPDGTELVAMGRRLLAFGPQLACISRGDNGALMLQGNRAWSCAALHVPVRSTVGAGDAMVAALACAFEQDLDAPEAFRLAMATAAGAVGTEGTQPPARQTVERLMHDVDIHELDILDAD